MLQFVTVADLIKRDEGNLWASVSYCPGSEWYIKNYGPRIITRFLYASREEAFRAKHWIDECACGNGCRGWHAVEQAFPHEKRLRNHRIERQEYARYGGSIPAIYLLPTERKSPWHTEASQAASLSLRYQILAQDRYRCRLCGVAAGDGPEVRLEMDHIIPRAKGGTDDPSNLWTLCFACNRGKRDREL